MATALHGRSFLDLPLEIRINIYRELFGVREAIVDSHIIEDNTTVRRVFCTAEVDERSSQFLRICKTIQTEAESVLHENTTFKFTRQVDFVDYMQPDLDQIPYVSHIRHLEVDFKPQILQDIPQGFSELRKCLRLAKFETLTDLKLTCHAIEWYRTDLVASYNLKIRSSFETAHEALEMVGFAFLKSTSMNCMEDKSKDGVHVVFQMSTITVPVQIGGVSRRQLLPPPPRTPSFGNTLTIVTAQDYYQCLRSPLPRIRLSYSER